MPNDLLMDFCKNRNLKLTTVKTYSAAIRKYESFHNNSIKFLINEAISDENTYIPLKNRRIKKRLLNFRNYLIANYSINTVRTYFSRIMAFYKHFEIKLLFFSFPAADVLRLKRFRWLLGILLGQLMIIIVAVL